MKTEATNLKEKLETCKKIASCELRVESSLIEQPETYNPKPENQ